jgi:hypothetical protein
MNDTTIAIFSSLYMLSSLTRRSKRGKCWAWRHFQFQSLATLLPSTGKCEKYYHLLEDLSTTAVQCELEFFFGGRLFTVENVLKIFVMLSVFSRKVL